MSIYPKVESVNLVDGDAFSVELQVVVTPSQRDHYLLFRPHMGDPVTYEAELTDNELDELARKIRTFRYAQ